MSNIKACLDAGHAGKENRSPVVAAYYESDFNWKLHLKLKKELESVNAKWNEYMDARYYTDNDE